MWTYPSRVAICSSHKALCSHKFEAYTPNPKEEDEEEGGNKEIDDVEVSTCGSTQVILSTQEAFAVRCYSIVPERARRGHPVMRT